MEKFISDLTSPYWWLSIGLAAVVFGIITNYVQKLIDRFYRGGIQWIRKRSEKRRKFFEYRVQLLLSHPERMAESRQVETTYGLVAAMMLMLTVGLSMFVWGLFGLIERRVNSSDGLALTEYAAIMGSGIGLTGLLLTIRFIKLCSQQQQVRREALKRLTHP